MLQNIRANSQGTLAKIIIGLIVISFSIFGIESLLVGGGSNAVAEVNGEEISLAELQQTVNLQKRRLLSLLGDDADPALLDDDRLTPQAMESLVQRKLLVQAAKAQGLAVSDEEVGAIIASMEQFQMDGQFSAPLYQNTLASAGYTSALFQQTLREDLLVAQLRTGLAMSEFATPAELAATAAVSAEQRDLRYLTLPLARFRDVAVAAITEDDIRGYYEENRDRFMSAERVDVSFIELTEAMYEQPVDEQEVREAYELAIQNTAYQEESRVAHILFEQGDDESDAAYAERIAEAQSALEQGMDFEEAAAAYSDDVGSADFGGDLGFTAGDTFPDAMEEAIAQLEAGEVSAPVQTDAGTHLIKVLERRAGESADFDAMRAELAAQIRSRDAREALLLAAERLRDLAFNAENLEGPAEALDVELQRRDGVRRNAGQDLFANPQVQSALFSEDVLELGYNSPVIELGPDRFVALRVEQHHESEVLPIEEVQEQIVASLAAERAGALASENASEIITRLASGESMDAIASDLGVEWQASLGVTRDSTSLPQAVNRRAFSLPAPESRSEPLRATAEGRGGNLYIVEVTRVVPGQLTRLEPADRETLSDRLAGEYAGVLQNRFERQLREKADITVY
jgi:peptidyl-prolyl cis-trans isomerase D